MRYLLLIYSDEKTRSMEPEKIDPCVLQEHGKLIQDLGARCLASEPLQPTSTATTVRVREGKTLVTDGPFAETKEQLGGFFLVDCESIDEAIEAAGKLPTARHGSIEVRPLIER